MRRCNCPEGKEAALLEAEARGRMGWRSSRYGAVGDVGGMGFVSAVGLGCGVVGGWLEW